MFKKALIRPWVFPTLRTDGTPPHDLHCDHLRDTLPEFQRLPDNLPTSSRLKPRYRWSDFVGVMIGVLVSILLSVVYINLSYVKTAKKKGGRADPEDRFAPLYMGRYTRRNRSRRVHSNRFTGRPLGSHRSSSELLSVVVSRWCSCRFWDIWSIVIRFMLLPFWLQIRCFVLWLELLSHCNLSPLPR